MYRKKVMAVFLAAAIISWLTVFVMTASLNPGHAPYSLTEQEVKEKKETRRFFFFSAIVTSLATAFCIENKL